MDRSEVCLLGETIGVDAPPAVVDHLLAALARRVDLGPGEGEPSVIYEVRPRRSGYDVVRLDDTSCELIDAAESVEQAADVIADNLHPWVAERHQDVLFVHAGAVAWNNIGIIAPGRAHAGKTSLVAALLRAGASYLSDEFAPIDRDGNVHPYPRHLSIRQVDGSTTRVPASHFGATTVEGPVPVGLIVDTHHEPDASFAPKRLRGAAALLAVIDNALVARSRPAYTMEIVAALTPHVEVLRSRRGDADEAAVQILAAVEAGLADSG